MRRLNHKTALVVLAFFLVVSAVGFFLDRLLVQEGVPGLGVMLLSNGLTGLVAAVLFLQVKVRAQERQRLLEERLLKVAEMNHHVRNALQVVSFYRYQITDPEASRLLQESIKRIEWTLEEVLPRGWNIEGLPLDRQVPPVNGARAPISADRAEQGSAAHSDKPRSA